MSVDGDSSSHAAFDSTDHQPAYVFTPSTSLKTRSGTKPPTKRRKLGQSSGADEPKSTKPVKFTPLLNNTESDACVRFRQDLFQTSWDFTAEQIQSVLSEANEDTLAGVTSFVQDPVSIKTADCTPTGFIVTGPNIASQALLFHQLSERLRENITGPVITLRSGDASNLKAALKKIIRDATNQKPSDDEDEDGISLVQDGRKLLYYDLEILHSYVKIHGCERAVVAFQDSEAFDSSLLTDLITLFASWLDRIPFVLLFGIATSVELFHERLPRTATRSLSGSQFDVAQTSSILEKLFQKAIGSSHAPIRLGPSLISSFLERQFDHVQSVQAFLAAIKYSYMCHFYANPLTILLEVMRHPEQIRKLLQPQHYEAIRNLPSFKKLIEGLLDEHDLTRVRDLLEDDTILLEEVKKALEYRDIGVVKVLRAAHILSSNEPGQALSIDLYIKAFDGTLDSSDAARSVLGSVKYMGPDELGKFLENTLQEIDNGCDILDLDGWAGKDNLYKMIRDIYSEVSSLIADVSETDTPIRSKYSAHKKVMRTTIVAQKVQLSHDVSKLTRKDDEFTTLIDRVVHLLGDCFTVPTPHDLFMNEIWLYDFKSPYKDVFTPKPRFAIERALSMPHDYLGYGASEDSLSSSQPATAILYQLYLETGSFINIFDLWSAFYAIVGGEDGEGMGERDALVLFYRALAELKLLGMVKQSKRKSDHLAKLAWKGM